MLTYDDIQQQFELCPQWMDRYQLMIEWGESLPPASEQLQQPEHLIKGCQSRVWVTHDWNGQRLHWSMDSDAAIVKGLLAMLLARYQDLTPQALLSDDTAWLTELGLSQHLSPTRSNGLMHVLAHVQQVAEAYKAAQS